MLKYSSLGTTARDTLIATGILGEIDDPALQIPLGAFTRFARDLSERESCTLSKFGTQPGAESQLAPNNRHWYIFFIG